MRSNKNLCEGAYLFFHSYKLYIEYWLIPIICRRHQLKRGAVQSGRHHFLSNRDTKIKIYLFKTHILINTNSINIIY